MREIEITPLMLAAGWEVMYPARRGRLMGRGIGLAEIYRAMRALEPERTEMAEPALQSPRLHDTVKIDGTGTYGKIRAIDHRWFSAIAPKEPTLIFDVLVVWTRADIGVHESDLEPVVYARAELKADPNQPGRWTVERDAGRR